MLVALPLSTNVLWTRLLAIFILMTRALVRGWCTYWASTSMNTMSLGSRQVFLIGCMSALCTNTKGRFLASFAYPLLQALLLLPTLCGPPNMVRISYIASRSLTRPLVITRLCLLECAISALGLAPST